MERIVAKDISKKFKIGFKKNQNALQRFISLFSGREPKKTFWAVSEVSFRVEAGEVVGIIGENGSGKSTLLRVIAGIYCPTLGNVEVNGKIIPLINLGLGMQFRLTMKDNIYLICALFGLGAGEVREKFDSIAEFAKLEDFVETKLYQFSVGMMQRLAFSIAVHCNPEILLLDEVFAVGDENFRNKSSETIMNVVKEGGSVMLVSHELWMIEKYCNRVIWLDEGRILKEGNTEEVVAEYKQYESENGSKGY